MSRDVAGLESGRNAVNASSDGDKPAKINFSF